MAPGPAVEEQQTPNRLSLWCLMGHVGFFGFGNTFHFKKELFQLEAVSRLGQVDFSMMYLPN